MPSALERYLERFDPVRGNARLVYCPNPAIVTAVHAFLLDDDMHLKPGIVIWKQIQPCALDWPLSVDHQITAIAAEPNSDQLTIVPVSETILSCSASRLWYRLGGENGTKVIFDGPATLVGMRANDAGNAALACLQTSKGAKALGAFLPAEVCRMIESLAPMEDNQAYYDEVAGHMFAVCEQQVPAAPDTTPEC